MTGWKLPSITNRADGRMRRVGVEIELQGIAVADLAALVAATLGGEATALSSAEYSIDVPGHGTYRVEIDFALLKQLARERDPDTGGDADLFAALAVDALQAASSVVVPCEIVSPPIPLDRLPATMDPLVDALRQAGAKGTRQSLLYAFGLHLNVETPSLDADTITRYLRAFVCLYDWIADESQIDLSRRMTPYIDAYGRDYELLVADPDYAPDLARLIDDYLAHNPTRDRALDMLPMFTHLDERRVRQVVDDPLVKARPAFHYRLANSSVDEPGWSVAYPWNLWMQIETLAQDPARLNECARLFIEDRQRLLHGFHKQWVAELRNWLAGADGS